MMNMGKHYNLMQEPGRLPVTSGEYFAGFSPMEGDNQRYGLATVPPPTVPLAGMDAFGLADDGSGGQGRWPRQETLTLLEIRTRLDVKFREASQKAPLWDEVSRIMAEEHGFQRSGKKCREKLENLYKYYKKTKEGKAGRQDGKHYRFFRQLEALYGENNYKYPAITTLRPYCSHVISPTEFVSSSSDEDTTLTGESWKSNIRGLVEVQMRRLMDMQEAWLDKMLMTLEHMEQARVLREEAWKKKEAARWEQEHRLWARERAWIEARDAALIEALEKMSSAKKTMEGKMGSMDQGTGELISCLEYKDIGLENSIDQYCDQLRILYRGGNPNEDDDVENVGVDHMEAQPINSVFSSLLMGGGEESLWENNDCMKMGESDSMAVGDDDDV